MICAPCAGGWGCLLSVIAGQEGVGRTCKNLGYKVDFRPVSSLGETLNGE